MTDIHEIIRTGNRAGFKQYLATCSEDDLILAWFRARLPRVQDFSELAGKDMRRRQRWWRRWLRVKKEQPQ
jgi:hypothetical protein